MTDFEPEDQELRALAKLHELVHGLAHKRGLILRQMPVFPNVNPDGPHLVHIITSPDPDFDKDAAETVSDPDFDRVMREAQMAEQEQKAEEARQSLERLRDNLSDRNKGIGLDD